MDFWSLFTHPSVLCNEKFDRKDTPGLFHFFSDMLTIETEVATPLQILLDMNILKLI
jgi:hypothetical protein